MTIVNPEELSKSKLVSLREIEGILLRREIFMNLAVSESPFLFMCADILLLLLLVAAVADFLDFLLLVNTVVGSVVVGVVL